MQKFYNWLRVKLGIVQIEKELSGIYKSVNRLDHKFGRLQNKNRSGKRPMRQDEVNRARKRRKKGPYKVADVF